MNDLGTVSSAPPPGILTLQPSGVIDAADEVAATLFGVAPDALTGLPVEELAASDDRAACRTALAEATDPGAPATVALRLRGLRGDETFPLEIRLRWAGGALAAVVRDLNALDRALEETRRYARMLEQAQVMSGVGNWEYLPEARVVHWSKGVRKVVGAPDDFRPTIESAIDLYAPEDRDRVRAAIDRAAKTGEPFDFEAGLIARDGSRRVVRAIGEAIRSGASVDRIFGTFQDLTDLRLADEKASRLAAIVDASDAAIFSSDLELRLTAWNPGAERLFGYAEAEVLGRPVSILAPEDKQAEVRRTFTRAMCGENVQIESERVRKDGRPIAVALTLSPIRDRTGALVGISAVARDVTAQRHMEEQLRRSQKLEALGVLSSGIAHDFNNILAAVRGHAELARASVEAAPALAEPLNEIIRAAERASGVVQRILSFSRRQPETDLSVEVAPTLAEAARMMRSLIPTTIDLRVRIDSDCGSVSIGPADLEQVLINLCTNAYQAMKARAGWIDIRARRRTYGGGQWAEIRVSDNAGGVPREAKDRVFDPFFTTKAVGEGVGLGLSVVHGIVTAHGGRVWLENEPGTGASFHVLLPLTDEAAADSRAERAEATSAPAEPGRGRVLLVEDEESVRKLAGRALEKLGYDVVVCAGPDAALDLAWRTTDAFDVVVSDLTMPSMTGLDLAERLREAHPDTPVVLMTGAGRAPLEPDLERAGVVWVLNKPFRLQELGKAVAAAFGEAHSPT